MLLAVSRVLTFYSCPPTPRRFLQLSFLFSPASSARISKAISAASRCIYCFFLSPSPPLACATVSVTWGLYFVLPSCTGLRFYPSVFSHLFCFVASPYFSCGAVPTLALFFCVLFCVEALSWGCRCFFHFPHSFLRSRAR